MGNVTNWLNLVFVIDESGSMYGSKEDTIGGFNSVIEEQRKLSYGKVTVSLYTFNDDVKCVFKGADINDVGELDYHPTKCTAMNDGIGTAIDEIGKWLYEKDVKGEEMPSKTLVVIMTDGLENASREYSITQVRDMIKEQTDKYSWEFIYIGADISTSKDADNLGIKYKAFTTKKKLKGAYNVINFVSNAYRSALATGVSASEANYIMQESLCCNADALTKDYETDTGNKITTA